MTNTFKSLMRNSVGEEVTWMMEWEKADLAKSELFAIVDAIPTVQAIARKMLEAELRLLSKDIDIDKVYVNTDSSIPGKEYRPSGTLCEVMFYCLDNNIIPTYVMGGDGVFFLPDTLSEQFKVSSLNVLIVKDLVSAVTERLEKTLRSELVKFWAAPVKSSRHEDALLTNKQAFTQVYALVTSAELSLAVMAYNFDVYWGERFAYLLNSDTGRGAFEVNLQPQQDYLGSLEPCFVLDNAERSGPEMELVNESTCYLMHTPENGFEFFEKNIDLHNKLQARLSLGSHQIKYLRAAQSPYSFCVEAHLKGQLESVSTIIRDRNELESSLTSVLQDNQGLHIMRYGMSTRFYLLWAALKRTEWPLWLKSASSSIQERYTQLEDSKDRYEVDYQAAFDGSFSFKDYVLRSFAEWTKGVLGEELDPQTITVHSSYKLQVAGRTIEQEETRTLTEFIVFGLHDDGHRAQISIKGTPTGSRLSVAALEQWLTNRNLRLQFVSDLPASPSADFQDAYRNRLYSKVEFALFAARHTGHFNDTDTKIISRAIAGDPSVSIRGLKIRRQAPALKDILVFSVRGYLDYLAFFRTPAGAFEFRKFSDPFVMNRWFESALSADREYAALLIQPDYLQDAGVLRGTSRTQLNYHYELDTTHADLYLDAKAPLADYVNVAYRAEVALHKAIAPSGYRALGVVGRKRYSRLTTELKALSTIDTRDNGFPSFEQFTYDSVKQKIEEILRARGSIVAVNPDQIMVQTEKFRKSVTDLLLEGLWFEATNPAYETKYSPKYYLVSGHPAVDKLDIRDLSSLSKTFRPGDKYTAMLKEQFQNKAYPDYAFKRAVHAKKIRCEMQRNLVTDFVNGRLSSEYFAAVQRVIDSLKESGGYHSVADNISEGNEGLYKFNIGSLGLTAARDRTVGDVYIFRLNTFSGFQDLLYTPDAPDLVNFRPIAEFVPSIRFLHGPFREYYSERILLVDQKVINDYFDKLVATVDTQPSIRTQNRAKLLDLYTFHDERVRRVLSDIDERTTSLNEVIAGLIYDNLLKAANIVSLLVPPVGTVVVAVQMMKSIYDASQSHRRGDYSAALGHVKEALTGLLTLGKAAAAGAPVKEITNAQRSFLSLFEDARTVAELVTHYTGQEEPKEMLIAFFKTLMENADSGLSKTTVR